MTDAQFHYSHGFAEYAASHRPRVARSRLAGFSGNGAVMVASATEPPHKLLGETIYRFEAVRSSTPSTGSPGRSGVVGLQLPSGPHRRSVARIPISGASLLALIMFVVASVTTVGYATHPSSGSSTSSSSTTASPYYDSFSAVKWLSPDGTLLATSSGANVSQGSTFVTSVVIGCPPELAVCSGTAVVNSSGAESLGSWPTWVSPCGYMRFTANVTASNLPLTLTPGATATVTMTLQAPLATYPNASWVLVQYNYTGWVEVTLTFAP